MQGQRGKKKVNLNHPTVNVKGRREEAVSKTHLQKPDGAEHSAWAIVRKPLITPQKYMSVSEEVH